VKKIILDENVPRALKQALAGHIVTTVQEQGWTGIENGELLALLDDKFDVFITADKNLRYQQNLAQRRIAIVELPFNARRKVLPLGQEILKAVESARLNDYIQI
jgi:hypothetical protein